MQVSRQESTRELFEKLASTEHRRSLTADRIFRELRKSSREASGITADFSRWSVPSR